MIGVLLRGGVASYTIVATVAHLSYCWALVTLIFEWLFVKRFARAIGPLSECPVLSCVSSLWRWCMWPSGSMDQDATWHGGRPRLRPHCVRWGPGPHEKGHSCPHPLFGPFCSGTVAHLSNCWAFVKNRATFTAIIYIVYFAIIQIHSSTLTTQWHFTMQL